MPTHRAMHGLRRATQASPLIIPTTFVTLTLIGRGHGKFAFMGLTPAWQSTVIVLVNALFICAFYLALGFSDIFCLPARDKILCQSPAVIDQVGASNQSLAGQQPVHFAAMSLCQNAVKEQIHIVVDFALFGASRFVIGTRDALKMFKDQSLRARAHQT